MAMAIIDSAARMGVFHRLGNTQNASSDNARLKAETAANYRRSTKLFEDAVAGGGAGLRAAPDGHLRHAMAECRASP